MRSAEGAGDAAGTTVLLGTYNGAAYLSAQLASIAAQSDPGWHLIASDDGSTDDTRALLDDFAADHPDRVTVVDGPRRGFAANFLSLLARVRPESRAAFCDQDDVWYPDKLARAAASLAAVTPDTPAFYAARSRLVGPDLSPRGLSRGLPQPAGFGNALVQNIASGNAMVFNPAAVQLLQQAQRDGGMVPMHDWWAYQLVTGAGGRVVFDDTPALDYRQHASNQLGGGRGLGAARHRAVRLFDGQAVALIARQADALAASAGRLLPEKRLQLDALRAALSTGGVRRLKLLREAGLWRQSRAGTALLMATLMAAPRRPA